MDKLNNDEYMFYYNNLGPVIAVLLSKVYNKEYKYVFDIPSGNETFLGYITCSEENVEIILGVLSSYSSIYNIDYNSYVDFTIDNRPFLMENDYEVVYDFITSLIEYRIFNNKKEITEVEMLEFLNRYLKINNYQKVL